jgi:hypothetical protein
MTRSALRRYIESLVVASLPLLGGPGCDQCKHEIVQETTGADDPGGIPDGGHLSASQCQQICPGDQNHGCWQSGFIDPSIRQNGIYVTCDDEYVICPSSGYTGGRRPAGLRAARTPV